MKTKIIAIILIFLMNFTVFANENVNKINYENFVNFLQLDKYNISFNDDSENIDKNINNYILSNEFENVYIQEKIVENNKILLSLSREQIVDIKNENNKNSNKKKKVSFPKISNTKATELALNYITNLAPDIAQYFDREKFELNYVGGLNPAYNVKFYRYYNNKIIRQNYISLYIDGNNGKLIRYLRVFDENLNFTQSVANLARGDGEKVFLQNNDLEQVFNVFMDNGKLKIFPCYILKENIFVNAYTGKIISNSSKEFDDYFATTFKTVNKITEKITTYNDALKLAEKIVKFDFDDLNLSNPDIFYDSHHNLCIKYYRQNQQISYKQNGIFFSFNLQRGTAQCVAPWDDIVFPPVNFSITRQNALDIFTNNIGFELLYIINDGYLIPVYSTNSKKPVIIGEDGQLLNYDGTKQQTFSTIEYTNFPTNDSKSKISRLQSININAARGGVVDLQTPIIQENFVLLLANLLVDGMPIYEKYENITDYELDAIYSAFNVAGYLEKKEVSKYKKITREESLKYIVRISGYDELAQLKNIYNCDYLDIDQVDKENYGYVALAKGLGYVIDHNSRLYPKEYLTYYDAFMLVYNYLENEESDVSG